MSLKTNNKYKDPRANIYDVALEELMMSIQELAVGCTFDALHVTAVPERTVKLSRAGVIVGEIRKAPAVVGVLDDGEPVISNRSQFIPVD